LVGSSVLHVLKKYLHEYLDAFEITREDFFKIVDKYVNFDLFKKMKRVI